MSRASTVPAEGDLLCEQCGYTLNGLPNESRCPECGEPIAPSTVDNPRREFSARHPIRTTFDVLFHPTQFFRSLQTRSESNAARYYGWTFYILTALLIQLTIWMHYNLSMGTGNWLGFDRWFDSVVPADSQGAIILAFFVMLFLAPLILFFIIEGVTRLAAHLSSWEAAYHGWRMPYPVVLRAMYLHAPHYVPATLLITATVFLYGQLLHFEVIDATTAVAYLYTICAEVVIAAAYLFWTYWIAMRNIMYANR